MTKEEELILINQKLILSALANIIYRISGRNGDDSKALLEAAKIAEEQLTNWRAERSGCPTLT